MVEYVVEIVVEIVAVVGFVARVVHVAATKSTTYTHAPPRTFHTSDPNCSCALCDRFLRTRFSGTC